MRDLESPTRANSQPISPSVTYTLLANQSLSTTDSAQNPEVDSGVKTIILPTLIQNNHWVLLVANVPITASDHHGMLDWYNSLPSYDVYMNECVEKIVQMLELSGSKPGSPLTHKKWAVRKRTSAYQENGNDCGVFALANAGSVTFKSERPKSIIGFREAIAKQLLRAARGQPLQFPCWSSQSHKSLEVFDQKVSANKKQDSHTTFAVTNMSSGQIQKPKKNPRAPMSRLPLMSLHSKEILFWYVLT